MFVLISPISIHQRPVGKIALGLTSTGWWHGE